MLINAPDFSCSKNRTRTAHRNYAAKVQFVRQNDTFFSQSLLHNQIITHPLQTLITQMNSVMVETL